MQYFNSIQIKVLFREPTSGIVVWGAITKGKGMPDEVTAPLSPSHTIQQAQANPNVKNAHQRTSLKNEAKGSKGSKYKTVIHEAMKSSTSISFSLHKHGSESGSTQQNSKTKVTPAQKCCHLCTKKKKSTHQSGSDKRYTFMFVPECLTKSFIGSAQVQVYSFWFSSRRQK